MKKLSFLTLMAGAFLVSFAALSTEAYAKPKWTCCNPRECLTLVVVQPNGPHDQIRFNAQSLCMQCRYPYQDRD
jgi:hypothetical protein